MRSRRIVFAILVVTFIGLLIALLWSGSGTPPSSSAPEKTSSQQPRASRESRSDSPPAPRESPKAATASALQTVRDAPDLMALLERHKSSPDPTGATAFHLGRSIDDCRSIGPSPRPQAEPAKRDIVQKQIQRCKRLFESGANLSQEVAELYRASLAAGFPAAVARDLELSAASRGRDKSDAIAIQLLSASPDGEVVEGVKRYLMKRNAAASPPPDEALTKSFAWMLVQCDFGQDCGPQSRMLVLECHFRGNCDLANIEDSIRHNRLTPAQYEAVLAARSSITQAIRSRDWARLGLLQQ